MFLNLIGVHGFGLYLLEFAVVAAIVLVVSSKLAVYADKLAGESKLTSGWIGFIILASITSLPELFVGVSSTGIVGSPDLIASDAIGSSAFNVVTLAVMLLVARKALVNLKIEDTLTAFAGMALMTLVGALIVSNLFFNVTPALSVVYSIVIVLSFGGIVFLAFKSGGLKEENLDDDDGKPGKDYLWKFILIAVVIFGTSIWLTKTADLLSSTPFGMGGRTIILGQTFIGALLLAIATALEELTVTIKCARLGNPTMGVSNVLGSNVFNILILPISAIFYRGNFWKNVEPANAGVAALAILLTSLMFVELTYRTRMKRNPPPLIPILTIAVWIGGMVALFLSGAEFSL